MYIIHYMPNNIPRVLLSIDKYHYNELWPMVGAPAHIVAETGFPEHCGCVCFDQHAVLSRHIQDMYVRKPETNMIVDDCDSQHRPQRCSETQLGLRSKDKLLSFNVVTRCTDLASAIPPQG